MGRHQTDATEQPRGVAPTEQGGRLTRVRFALKADKSSHRSEMMRWANALNRCAIGRPLRRCRLFANMVVADGTIRDAGSKMRKPHLHHMDLNDEHPAIGDTVIILTSMSKQFRLDKVELLKKLVRAMMLQSRREDYRVQVVERDLFTTPNSLKLHEGVKGTFPTCAILVP